MSPLAKKVERAQAGHNRKRSLDAIGADLRKLRNIFDSGELLVEAWAACEYGEWLDWLDTYFDASEDTAERHMAAYRLSLKFRTVRNLKVPPTIIYELGEDLDAPGLPNIIEALGKASKSAKKPLGVDDCKRVITVALARETWGDLPDAALIALNKNSEQNAEWAAEVVERLKQERPDTDEAADKLVVAEHRKYFEARFGGPLPDWLDKEALRFLEGVDPKYGKQVRAKLQAAAQPLDDDIWRKVIAIVHQLEDLNDAEDQDDAEALTPEPANEQDGASPSASPPTDLDAELLEALHVILHHARRPMPTSVGGIKGHELVEAKNFIEALHEIATGGSTVKRIAAAAEARSRSGKAANGEGLTERWSES